MNNDTEQKGPTDSNAERNAAQVLAALERDRQELMHSVNAKAMTDAALTNRRQHALAAVAAGLELHWVQDEQGNDLAVLPQEGCRPWRPKDDDGDALRLAVKLNMHVIIDGENSHVRVYARSWAKVDDEYGTCGFGSDPYAATRRAIVRAAAEIGKAMP